MGLTKVTCFGSLSPFPEGTESLLFALLLFLPDPRVLKVDVAVLDTGGGWCFPGLVTSDPCFPSVMVVVEAVVPPPLSSQS